MKKISYIFLLLLGFSFVTRAELPERPNPPRLVNDFAGVLSSAENQNLESQLVQFARETSTQIVLVTRADLDGYDPGDYAARLGEKWGVGQKDKDNGIVVLLKPKTAESSGQIFIATGYGLEGILPDAIVNRTVVDYEMIPYFKQNDYYSGLSKGIGVIMDITRGEYTAENYQETVADQSGGIIPIIIILVLVFIVLPILRSRRNRFYTPGDNLPFWLAISLLGGRNNHRGSFNDFSSGSGGFGGFGGGSGGGFGGFGGGSFGGGGAGGSW